MNYKEKIREIELEIDNRVEYIDRVMNLLEKPTDLNRLKYLLRVIRIELDQL